MPPAEIYQGGVKIQEVKRNRTHIGRLNGHEVIVRDKGAGQDTELLSEELAVEGEEQVTKVIHLSPGSSITLDGGEIVKATSTYST